MPSVTCPADHTNSTGQPGPHTWEALVARPVRCTACKRVLKWPERSENDD